MTQVSLTLLNYYYIFTRAIQQNMLLNMRASTFILNNFVYNAILRRLLQEITDSF